MTGNYSNCIDDAADATIRAMAETLRTAMVSPDDEGRCIQTLMHAGWRARQIEQNLDAAKTRIGMNDGV